MTASPPILSYGFRPFFLLGSVFAALAVPVWLVMLASGYEAGGAFLGRDWHVHEMIFGYLGAVIAGFVLTAIPNWTGRLPVSGWPLGALATIWLVGRLAVWGQQGGIAFLLDISFLLLLAAAVWREIIAGKHFRGVPVAVMVSLFATANVLFHLQLIWPVLTGYGERLALAAATLLMALIGGRITPSFTRNWLVKAGAESLPRPFGSFDKAVLSMTALAMVLRVVTPDHASTGVALALAGCGLFLHMARWRSLHTVAEPIVFVLHLGYFWLALAPLLMGASTLAPGWIDASTALHALTVGAAGTLTLAVMTRATLGHTGREIGSSPATIGIYAFVTLASLARIAAPYLPGDYVHWLGVAGLSWTASYTLFVVVYEPMLVGPRVDALISIPIELNREAVGCSKISLPGRGVARYRVAVPPERQSDRENRTLQLYAVENM